MNRQAANRTTFADAVSSVNNVGVHAQNTFPKASVCLSGSMDIVKMDSACHTHVHMLHAFDNFPVQLQQIGTRSSELNPNQS